MRTFGKALLGVISFEPIVFFALFFLWLLPSFWVRTANKVPSLFEQRFDDLLPLAIVSSFVVILLLLTYAVLLARRPDVAIAEKVGVLLGIVFSNGIILPLVWWVYVWRESNLSDLPRKRRG